MMISALSAAYRSSENFFFVLRYRKNSTFVVAVLREFVCELVVEKQSVLAFSILPAVNSSNLILNILAIPQVDNRSCRMYYPWIQQTKSSLMYTFMYKPRSPSYPRSLEYNQIFLFLPNYSPIYLDRAKFSEHNGSNQEP